MIVFQPFPFQPSLFQPSLNCATQSWEYLVLGELGWDLHAVIPNHFLDLILRRLTFVGANKRTMIQKHAELFISLCASGEFI